MHILKALKENLTRIFFYLKHPYGVSCLECGFLSFGEDAVTPAQRIQLHAKRAEGYLLCAAISCSKDLWIEYDLSYSRTDPDGVFHELAKQRRDCKSFIRFNPGWSPSKHDEILLKRLERWIVKKSSIVTAIFVLAAVVAILTYLGIKPTADKTEPQNEEVNVSSTQQQGATVMKTEENIDVRSYDQSGGITAGKIIVDTQPRKITPAVIARLEESLPPDIEVEIEIVVVMGDQEAFQFAQDIKTHLESRGRKINGVNQAIFREPVKGQSITPDGTKITIGGME